MATETISAHELEAKLKDLLKRVQEGSERFVITSGEGPEAVLLGAEDFEGLLETLEILSDEEQVRRLIDAEGELATGGGHSLDDVRRELRRGHGPTLQPR